MRAPTLRRGRDEAIVSAPSDPIGRFWSKVEKTETCWLWTAARNQDGYGMFWLGTMKRAHRVAYEWAIGRIPDGLELDHLCRVRHCVNPAHLEPVSHGENDRRRPDGGIGAVASSGASSRTRCVHGHPYTADNLYRDKKGRRFCRTCRRLANRKAVV